MDSADKRDFCPKCLQESLVEYFDEDTGIMHGAHCENVNCGFKGFNVNGKLRQLIEA